MSRYWCEYGLLLAAVFGVGSIQSVCAQGDGKVKLQWKAFDPEAKPFYQVLESKTSQVMKVEMGQEMVQEQTRVLTIRWTPQPRKGNNLVVKLQNVGLKLAIKIGETRINYDTWGRSEQRSSLTDVLNSITKAELTLVIDPVSLKVKEILRAEDAIEKLNDNHSQMRSLINSILGDNAVRQAVEHLWIVLPEDSVNMGAIWSKKSVVEIGAMGIEKTDSYTYEGIEKNKDKITIHAKAKTSIPPQGNGVWQIKKGTSLNGEGSGIVFFDRAKGRIDSSIMKMKINGVVVIDIGNVETIVELRQSEESRLTIRDTIPEMPSNK